MIVSQVLEAELPALHKASQVSRSLAEMPGIGPAIATSFALTVTPQHSASDRHFAAWPGLTPKEHSTGDKKRLGRINKAGNERLRQLLERKPRTLAAVALANKMARILWAMMAHGEAYRRSPA